MLVSPNLLQFFCVFFFVAVLAVARADYREFRAISVSSELDAKVKKTAQQLVVIVEKAKIKPD